MKAPLVGNNKIKGGSTLEILIALAILISVISAVIMVSFGNQAIAVDTVTNAEALYKAQSMLEAARGLSRQNFDAVAAIPVSADDIYQKSLTVEIDPFNPDVKKVTSVVNWNDTGRTLGITLSTLLTNFSSPNNTCSPTLSGDWTAPQVYGHADFPSSAGATGLYTTGGKAYVTSIPSSGNDDLYIFDVSSAGLGDPTLSMLGSTTTTSLGGATGLVDVRTVGNYAFVATKSTVDQLRVIDVSNPAKLLVVNRTILAANDADGNTLAYSNKKLYFGLEISSGPEFYVIDVSTPTSPVVQGTYEVGAAVNGIVVKNNIAYLSTASTTQVIALNVSDPYMPTPAGSGYVSPTLTGQSLTLDSAAGTLYFGRIGGSGNPRLLALDTANLPVPKWTFPPMSYGVYGMVIRSNLLFMTTADPNDGLQIWDVFGASPTRHDSSPLNIQQTATAATNCSGNLLYVGQRSQHALQVIGPFVPFDYSLSASAPSIAVTQGSSGSNSISASLVSGISQNVTFSASIPVGATGVTASFTPNKCIPNCSTTITVNTAAGTPPGTYPITVTGTGGQTTTFNLIVSAAPFDYSISTSGGISVRQTKTGVVTITTSLTSGVGKLITVATSSSPTIPASVAWTLDKTSCTPTCAYTLTIIPATDSATKNQSYTITIIGSPSDVGAHSASFVLTVKP